MDTEKAIRTRHSARAFESRPVDPKLIEKVLELSLLAPSGCNIQPFQLAVATGDLLKKMTADLVDHAKHFEFANEIPWSLDYPQRYKARQRDAGFGLYSALGIARDDKKARRRQFLRNFEAFSAPGVVFVFTDKEVGEYATLDVGCWMQTFLLAAQVHGLSTVAQTSLAAYPQVVRKYFDVPDHLALVCAVAFGYADQNAKVNQYSPGRVSTAEMLLQKRKMVEEKPAQSARKAS